MMQFSEATSKKNCAKKYHSDPSHLETPKDIATKSGETHVRHRAIPSCKFHADRREIPISEQKIHISFWIFLEGTAPKRKENLSGTHIYHHAQFHADPWHRRRDIWSHTKRRAQSRRYTTKRILASRLSYKNHTAVSKFSFDLHIHCKPTA